MSAVVSLAGENRQPKIGDFVTLEFLINDSGDWGIQPNHGWIPSGSLSLYAPSFQRLKTGENEVKYSLQAMVHQPGALVTGTITLRQGERELLVEATRLQAEVAAPNAKEGQEEPEPPWTLPAVPFGGWSIPMVSGLAVLCLLVLGAILRQAFRRLKPLAQKLSPREEALQALRSLQPFASEKQALRQEEWKRFSYKLAGILRKFSDSNFGIETADLTDREFLAELQLQAKAAHHANAVARILTTIDEVRYGTKALDVTVVPNLLLEAKRFVELTSDPLQKKEGRR